VRVGGWLPGTGGRRNLAGSVLMGLPRPGALEFAVTVGSGLTVAERENGGSRCHGGHRTPHVFMLVW
jgi:ATP-dependent DNA ligase